MNIKIDPQINKKGVWGINPASKSDREIRILKESGEWELSTIGEVRAGNRFRIYAVPSTGFVTGYDNGYVITEYEATSDAYMKGNGAWGIDCRILED